MKQQRSSILLYSTAIREETLLESKSFNQIVGVSLDGSPIMGQAWVSWPVSAGCLQPKHYFFFLIKLANAIPFFRCSCVFFGGSR